VLIDCPTENRDVAGEDVPRPGEGTPGHHPRRQQLGARPRRPRLPQDRRGGGETVRNASLSSLHVPLPCRIGAHARRARTPEFDLPSPWPRWIGRPARDYERVLEVASHEFFHLWNVKRIHPKVLGPFDYEKEVYTRLLWVMEGLTSYYDDLMIRRAKLYTEKRYLRKMADAIHAFRQKPSRRRQSLTQSELRHVAVEVQSRPQHRQPDDELLRKGGARRAVPRFGNPAPDEERRLPGRRDAAPVEGVRLEEPVPGGGRDPAGRRARGGRLPMPASSAGTSRAPRRSPSSRSSASRDWRSGRNPSSPTAKSSRRKFPGWA